MHLYHIWPDPSVSQLGVGVWWHMARTTSGLAPGPGVASRRLVRWAQEATVSLVSGSCEAWCVVCKLPCYRAAALTSQSHATKYFRMARRTQSSMAAEQKHSSHLLRSHPVYYQHDNCTTATLDTVILGKFRAACVSKITVELTTFLPCIPVEETECNGSCCGSFMASDVKCSHTLLQEAILKY